MEVTIKEKDDIKIIAFGGQINTSTSPEADKIIQDLIAQGALKILINFEDLDFISSTGLRVLLGTAKAMNKLGGQLRLCALNEEVQEVFDISGFSSIFEVFPSESIALDGF